MTSPLEIRSVSDTAIWVAHYRAVETGRADAMFRDPFARLLTGERGGQIARTFGRFGRYTEWIVLTRTVIIDDFIMEAIRGGVDAVINLGAGLDTRPYRLDLPPSFQWVEADQPHVVEFMNESLKDHAPRCRLQRVAVDLSDPVARRKLLAGAAPEAKRILVLTEGVVPYLTEEQVAGLAADLASLPRFAFWLVEYFSPRVYPYLRATGRSRKMVNAPFRFYPREWEAFFRKNGWVRQETHYSSEVGQRFGRTHPMPWWVRMLMSLSGPEAREQIAKSTGFMLMKPGSPST
jgi:methyltransferase (TIGR00027 family)